MGFTSINPPPPAPVVVPDEVAAGPLVDRPASADAGQMWWDTTNNQMTVYDGTSWAPLAAVADIPPPPVIPQEIQQGTLAARPASAPVGDQYWDTDNNQMAVFDGTSWVPLALLSDIPAPPVVPDEIGQGPIASRPATAPAGHQWWDTDTGQLAVFNGTSWDRVAMFDDIPFVGVGDLADRPPIANPGTLYLSQDTGQLHVFSFIDWITLANADDILQLVVGNYNSPGTLAITEGTGFQNVPVTGNAVTEIGGVTQSGGAVVIPADGQYLVMAETKATNDRVHRTTQGFWTSRFQVNGSQLGAICDEPNGGEWQLLKHREVLALTTGDQVTFQVSLSANSNTPNRTLESGSIKVIRLTE